MALNNEPLLNQIMNEDEKWMQIAINEANIAAGEGEIQLVL